jgi:hypothetical protein
MINKYYDRNINKLSLLKDKLVKTLFTINKFIPTNNFFNPRNLVNNILYLFRDKSSIYGLHYS